MKEQKTINDLNTKIQNLRNQFDISDEMYAELNEIIDCLIGLEDKPYQKIVEEFKNMVLDEIELLQNWCGGCSVCKTIPEPKDWSMTDIVEKLQELENKYLGVDNNV